MMTPRGAFTIEPVQNIDNPSSVDAIKSEMQKRKPFVIRNNDLGPCSNLWTASYLSEKVGPLPVKIHVSSHPKLDFIKKNFSYKTLPFDELMSRIHRVSNENHFLHPGEVYYLRSLGSDPRGREVANFMKDFPQIADDLRVPQVFDENDFFSAIFRASSGGVQLWTHYDIMDNILMQIRGRKRVILWPPSEVNAMYLIGDKSEVIDIDLAQTDKYPKFLQAKRYECTLDEGDIIFIPALWFHNISALESSISVNVFWKNLPHDLYDKKDSYGNKDLIPASKAFATIEKSLKSLDNLPYDYKDFYIRRLICNLQARLGSLSGNS